MKKTLVHFLALCVLAAAVCLPLRAEAASVSIGGSSSGIRAGSTVTLTVYAGGTGLTAINGSFSGISGMSLSNVSSARSGWTVTLNGNTFTTYDTAMTNPINSNSAVLTATFTVSKDVSPGSTVSAGVSGVTASDTDNTITLGSASWSATVAAPLSGNANLSSLTCSDGALSPSFESGTTSYSLTVPYSVTSLHLNYARAHSGASVTVSGNDLVVGANTVTVTVTAENGSRKQYYISVTREQDPNYQASTNALLSALSVSAGTLSPAFDPSILEYVAYVPFEVKDITLSGVAQDSKALRVKGVTSFLKPGDNPLPVVCTAEDGETVAVYTVHVFRMPYFNGVAPLVSPAGEDPAVPVIDPVTPENPDDSAGESLLSRAAALAGFGVTLPLAEDLFGPVPLWVLCAVALALLVLLFYLLGTLAGKAAGRRQAQHPPEEPAREERGADPLFPRVPPPVTGDVPVRTAPVTAAPAEAAPAPAAPAETAPAGDPPAEQPPAAPEAAAADEDSVHTMSLDDLLKDIRNM